MKQTAQAGVSKVLITILVGVLLIGFSLGAYVLGVQSKAGELSDKQDEIDTLNRKVKALQSPSPGLGSQGSDQLPASQTTTYSSANIGFGVSIPQAWAGQWRYNENGSIGISTSSVTFYLINKDTKYAEVVTVAKIEQKKYDDAKATGQAIGNKDNELGAANGYVFVMTFPQKSEIGDYKNFTYEEAVKAARESFKSSFKTL